MTGRRVLALFGVGVVDPEATHLRADDLGALRGDGAFETLPVRDRVPYLLDEHLARLVDSARLLEIALPPVAELVALVAQACAAWPAGLDGALRLICTRGPAELGPPTVYVTVGDAPAGETMLRRLRPAVLTACLGVAVDARAGVPWLLCGAKTLSYAVNMACQRWAAGRGAEDALWTSVEGYALEAPTASLLWLDGGVLCTVPPESTGVLPGITARHLLDRAGELGLTAAERLIRAADLAGVDGVWLTSSLRGIAEVRSLDGVPLRPSEYTARLREMMGYRPFTTTR